MTGRRVIASRTMSSDDNGCVLRARIGVRYPVSTDRKALQDRIAEAIRQAVVDAGGQLDVLQLDLAARPDWDQFGPLDRVTGVPLWKRPRTE